MREYKNRLSGCVALLSGTLITTSSYAQTQADFLDTQDELLLFEDIPTVYAASKYEQKVTDAPSSISIVTAEEIQAYGYRTLSDVLQSLRGFYTTNDYNYGYVGVRGLARPGDYNSRLLFMVDGHRINEGVYGAEGIQNDFLLDIDLIDRIEVVRGASSSLYGTNAFFGVINIITKRGRDFRDTELSVDVAANGSYGGRLTYGDRYNNGLELLLSASHYESDGLDEIYFPEFDDPATNNGIALNADSSDHESFFSRLSYGDFEFEAAYVSRTKVVPTGSYETLFNAIPPTFTVDDKLFINASHVHDFNTTTTLTTRLAFVDYEYWGDYTYDYADVGDPPDITVYKDDARGRSWETNVTLSKIFDRHTLTVGGEFRDNMQLDQRSYDPYDIYLDDQRDSRRSALFLQEDFSLTERLNLIGGLRLDDYDGFDTEASPRVALIYSLPESIPGDTVLKVTYGEAFRAPNAYELFYDDGGFTNKAALVLDPETIATTELIVEHYFNPNLIGILSVYDYEIDDLVEQITDPLDGLLVFSNTGRINAQGASIALEGQWSNRISGRVSYSAQTAEDALTGARLTNSPRNMLKANMMVPLFNDRLTAGLELQYTSERRTWSGRFADSNARVNLTLTSKELMDGLSVSASFYNLFDEQYSDPASPEHVQDMLPQLGRIYRVHMNYRF